MFFSHFLYPRRSAGEEPVNGEVQGKITDGKYELFDHMNEQVKTEIKDLILNSKLVYLFINELLVFA